MQTYLFYDLETTGLSKSFDQILHFAAIRTDLQLNELARHELKIKLNPDLVPSPHALITHKISIQEMQQGIPEFEAMQKIHGWLNQPGTISIGYNTLSFDDEFLRFSFYRNLLKPYTHQFANQCHRMDIYPMTIMFFLFKKNVLKWPIRDGRVSLKLENLNSENQFVNGRSHHAMVDVEITLALARKLMQEREMWDYLHGYFKKEMESVRIKPLEQNMALLINGKLGSQAHYHCPVMFLGKHRHYQNQSIWLRLDSSELSNTTAETLAQTSQSISKKAGEPNFILPCQPRFLAQLAEERLTLAEKNHQWLNANPDLLAKIKDYHLEYKYPVYPEVDIEASLYLNGFWTAEEEFFCQRFHTGSLEEKRRLIQQTEHTKIKILAERILNRNYGEEGTLYNHERTVIDYQGKPRMNTALALAQIQELRTADTLAENDLILLAEFEKYLSPPGNST